MAKQKKPRKEKPSRRSIGEEYARDKRGVDRQLARNGLTYGTVVGAVILIIGVLLILFNLTQALVALVGIVLVYFGLKMMGWGRKTQTR